ncbi:MAG: chromate transporter [Bacteroides sp.]|nr:chromate transporter [Bacillota bacterium]MCM1393337.1 chromate transporter [[Eubacterium] siraeum]MCM1455431.1 chromate transporter [Bacteroides sp.]
MIYLDLFWTFFKIGLFTIGGGQAMIPMIMTNVVDKGWLAQESLIDFIAISESTPGPFAVNIATYTGIETADIFGAICATLGVVLPSVIIITIVAKLLSNFMKRKAVSEVFVGVRSTVTGLLTSVFITLLLTMLFGITSIYNVGAVSVDYVGIGLFAVILPVSFIKIKGKKMKPILIVILSAALGVLCYGLLDYFGVTL